MFIDWDAEQTITSFRYLPPQDTTDGMVTHYSLWGSTDWGNWTKLASGEFSNIVNNPIWQTVRLSPAKVRSSKRRRARSDGRVVMDEDVVKVRVLRFDADRLASGERMGYGDIEVVIK